MEEKKIPEHVQFEKDVKLLYEAFGFKVYHDELNNANQIDLVAELQKAGMLYRNLIECKCYKADKVGIDEINIFIGRFLTAKQNKEAEKGIIVTTVGFTRDAKEAAKNAGVELFTYAELFEELSNFRPMMRTLIDEWAEAKENKYYVEPSGRIDGESSRKPLTPVVVDKIESPRGEIIALLGEYGSGKSIFLQKLAAFYANQYLKSNCKTKIPILVRLKDLVNYHNIRDLIQMTIKNYGVEFASLKVFNDLLYNGKFLLLMDGLDEIRQDVDEDLIIEQLSHLNEVMKEGSSAILTCRSNYFQGKRRATAILKDLDRDKLEKSVSPRTPFSIIWLEEFNKNDISAFLTLKLQDEAQHCIALLEGTYNLSDLAKRPILLEIISRMIPELKKIKGRVNAARLYEIYTDTWIERERQERSTSLLPKAKRMVCHEVAWHLHVNSRLEISFRQLNTKLKSILSASDNEEAVTMEILFDVQVCSFLEVGENKTLHFAHRSFAEFFCAQKLAREILNDHLTSFKSKRISFEIYFFLRDIIGESRLIELFNSWATENPDRDLKGKAIWSLHLHGSDIKLLDLRETNFNDIVLDNHVFKNIDFSGSTFIGSHITGAQFLNCKLENCVFRTSTLEKTSFAGSIAAGIDFSNARLNEADLRNVIFTNAFFCKSILSEANLENADLRNSDLSNAVYFRTNLKNAVMRDCKIIKQDIVRNCHNWKTAKWTPATLNKLKDAETKYFGR